jgi:acyl-CoA reductase-like NAD-dependent aldehyde dehydrogenase
MYMRIDGKDCASLDNEWIDVKNPATGEFIDRVPGGTTADVDGDTCRFCSCLLH